MHGKGKYMLKNGTTYEGDFLYDRKHGYGIITYAGDERNSKRIFKGLFEFGKQNGEGELAFANGDVLKGLWKDGEFVSEAKT
jgi:hypothetical protein